jgi:hypothetical protein
VKVAIPLLLIVCLATTSAQLSTAQGMGMRPPDIAGVFNPTVGAGATYEAVKDGEKTTFDMSVVDKDASGGYWIEDGVQNSRMGGPVYMKSLLTRQANDVIVQRMIMQIPGHPPMEMTSMMSMHGMQSQESKADFRADAENLGTESVTTAGGTFSCQHWRSKKDNTEAWLSDKVSPWKLVKMTGSDNNTITLVRVITEAKTHITGTPVSMEEMMQQHMGNRGNPGK